MVENTPYEVRKLKLNHRLKGVLVLGADNVIRIFFAGVWGKNLPFFPRNGRFTYMHGWFLYIFIGKYTSPMDPTGFILGFAKDAKGKSDPKNLRTQMVVTNGYRIRQKSQKK